MDMRRSMLIFCALLSLPLRAAETAYTLVERWQVNFGRGQDHATYKTAVCPDGTFYLADSFGRVAAIDAKGKVLSRKVIREFMGATALACNAESLLYVANPKSIFVMRGEIRVSVVPTDVWLTALALASDGSMYAGGSTRPETLPLHHLDRDGRIVKSFGIERSDRFNRVFPRWEGKLVWQEAIGRLLYVPALHGFEIQAYRADGSSIGVFGAQGSNILPVRVSDAAEPALGQSTGVAALPHNELAVQREVAQWNWRTGPSRMLEIYDANLRRLGAAESDARGLAGSAPDGDLYFTTLSPRGLQVFKVGLIKRLSL
jgi:hypothetical protein